MTDINLEISSDSNEIYNTDESTDSTHTSDDDFIDDDCQTCRIQCGKVNIFDSLKIVCNNRFMSEFADDYKMLCENLAQCQGQCDICSIMCEKIGQVL